MDLALLSILRTNALTNEDGDLLSDFEPRGRDSLDFTNVSRWTLHNVMAQAYAAGRNSK
jgi:hypothetical protein